MKWMQFLLKFAICHNPISDFYQLQNMIGLGNFSEVFLALVKDSSMHEQHTDLVAVKVIKKDKFDKL